MLRTTDAQTSLTNAHREASKPRADAVDQQLSDWTQRTQTSDSPCWQRESRAALGLICRDSEGQREYLFRYNRKWQLWNFVAGHFEPGQDRNFADTMIREFIEETGEEIGETPPIFGRDFSIEPLTTAPLQSVRFSGSAQQWTKYEFHVFWITLHGDVTLWDGRWQRHPTLFRWFTKAELQETLAQDGQTLASPFPLGALLTIM